ncbi:Hypoxia up-regulated protein 1 [Frankliniella fusca]|uniref:Hypoxia up-regulated protein 1 n=1 Tax=Frankliniella fusca TaxID=407009 RepID=A0AAE1HPP8_9NEOP|nr:Hypoxia up-regulated protein 1 [Frankliniella fusca]
MIICKIIDNALARDFLLKKNDDPGENFFVLTVNTPMEGTILCKIGECKKRTHTIAISRSKTRAWSVYNFYRHIRSSHLSEEAEKSQKRTKRQRKLDFSNIEKSKESIESSQEFLSDNPDSPPSLIDDHNEDSGNQEENDSTSIWQLPKYQRSERNKRGLETEAQSSHTITEYWPVLNKIEAAIKENESLHTTVRLLLAKLSEVPESPPTISNFLMCLNDSAAKNANKKKGGERYTDELSLIATHFFMLAGPKAYSDLYGNLPKVIPCPSTVENVMKRNKSILVEGEFRWKALSEFLEERGYPREVVMQEDATKCIGCVQYDPSSNQMIGFVPNLDNRGLPEILKFPATSEDVMRGYFESKETSQYVYCILARPLKDFASSFVVSCFGTNNKFKADHVKARWPYELQAAAAHNIQIKVFSSDGDTRCLSTMRELMFQACGNPLSWHFWFRATLDLKVVCVQDPTHVATKLRNLLLRSKILCVGDYYISVNHIRFMMENTSKDQHKLADEDINPKDRMNFKSAETLFSKTVTTLSVAKAGNVTGKVRYNTEVSRDQKALSKIKSRRMVASDEKGLEEKETVYRIRQKGRQLRYSSVHEMDFIEISEDFIEISEDFIEISAVDDPLGEDEEEAEEGDRDDETEDEDEFTDSEPDSDSGEEGEDADSETAGGPRERERERERESYAPAPAAPSTTSYTTNTHYSPFRCSWYHCLL